MARSRKTGRGAAAGGAGRTRKAASTSGRGKKTAATKGSSSGS